MDVVLRHVFHAADENYRQTHPDVAGISVSLVAIGGYGRGELSPYSDIDIMFLHDSSARTTSHHPYLKEMVEQVLYMLWDVGLKVGHSTRSVDDAVTQANKDMQSKTSMIESRWLIGDEKVYESFQQALVKGCVKGHEDEYIAARMEDQRARHEKYGDTVYLQEPNVKGRLRRVARLPEPDLDGVLQVRLSETFRIAPARFCRTDRAAPTRRRLRFHPAGAQCDALHDQSRVRRDRDRASTANRHRIRLPPSRPAAAHRNVHARLLHALAQHFPAHQRAGRPYGAQPAKSSRFSSMLRRSRKPEELDGFLLRDGMISAGAPTIFKQDPLRLIRVFHYVQQRDVEMSPELRSQIRQNLKLVDRSFRCSEQARDVFLAILQHKGQVARILRRMHEVEFLGKPTSPSLAGSRAWSNTSSFTATRRTNTRYR
jgi:[protein-PII] uridylyltransferase